MTASAWQQVVRALAGPGYGYRYRRRVLDSLRYVDVQDLATGGEHIPELGDVFVDLGLVSRAAHRVDDGKPPPAGDDGAERHSLGDLLGRRQGAALVLVGQPGSGKSTLLAHAAAASARPALGGRPGRRNVPVLLALRDQAGAVVADPAVTLPAVIRAASGGLPGGEPRGWWERQLRRGRCLIMLDGLDEVARAEDRLAVADWAERQIAAYPGNCFVITSRAFGLLSPLSAHADVFTVRPFTAEQVRLFLDRWCLAAEQHATGARGRTAQRAVQLRARESAARLGTLLREHPALQELAVNPLLLTMMVTAHRYRGALPGSRAELYAEMCQVLLSRRGQSKGLPELLPWAAKQSLLATLAYQMMRDHVTDLPAARVAELLGPPLERFPASVTGAAFTEDVARNGMLTEVAHDRYAFSHLTFQEYLAARHVSASPDLVKSLADNVTDPWWHEAIRLYAATADASPVVRSCLESGTIPALTLAFDCAEAGTEIDPDLRRRLDRERARAFEPGCPAGHRRLIAGVLAARHVRRTLTAAGGTRVCAVPVPADLYWLFLQDTGAPSPDSPCPPEPDQVAAGVWGTEARAFVAWLNSVTATATATAPGVQVRLPLAAELGDEAVGGALSSGLPAAVTSAWVQAGPRPGLWLRPGQPQPHELSGAALRAAVAADAREAGLLPQVLTAAVLDVAMKVIRDLSDIRALGSALDGDIAARAGSEGEVVELMHAHARGIVLTYTHALNLTRVPAITYTCAAHPELIRDLGLGRARALADAVAGDLAEAVVFARARARELAEQVELDLNILGAFDFDLERVRELARAHGSGFGQAFDLARGLPRSAELDLAGVLGLPAGTGLDPAVPLPRVLGLPLRWVGNGPLADAVLRVLAATPATGAGREPGNAREAFAAALAAGAGVEASTRLRADLAGALDGLDGLDGKVSLDGAVSAPSATGDGGPDQDDWRRAAGLARLAEACGPVRASRRPPAPADAAAIRAVALALATGTSAVGEPGGADGTSGAAGAGVTPGLLRTVAATVTLVEQRGNGTASTGEAVILALD